MAPGGTKGDEGTPDDLAQRVVAGERRALARAITLVESSRDDHRAAAESLLQAVLPATGRSVRIGISGAPGVGKSTFVEAFGQFLIEHSHRVAVLAVDPSSRVSGGSILGDKTRMGELARRPEAFIRPSPTAGSLGGVARRTREALLLCEAAGFDVVIVETVGVGQSETAVADMVDMLVLLLQPSGGDELQGLKRGIVELADILVVTKADGALADAARVAQAEYQSALKLLRPGGDWQVPVLRCSALEGTRLGEIWEAVRARTAAAGGADGLARRRADQALAWMWSEVRETLEVRLRRHSGVAERVAELEAEVRGGRLTPHAAARMLLAAFMGDDGGAARDA